MRRPFAAARPHIQIVNLFLKRHVSFLGPHSTVWSLLHRSHGSHPTVPSQFEAAKDSQQAKRPHREQVYP